MKTLKTSRQFKGDAISLRALCQLENRSLPFSTLDVVATDGVRHFSGQISSGDVDCTWEMSVWQNGFWAARGDFHDGGLLAGDFFFAEFLLNRDHSVGAKLEGSILNIIDSRHLSISKNGSDSWVRENWHTFEGSGPTVRLHAAPAVGQLVATPIVLLAAVPFVVFAAAFVVIGGVVVIGTLASGKHYELRPCPPDPFDTSKACVQAVPVPNRPEQESNDDLL